MINDKVGCNGTHGAVVHRSLSIYVKRVHYWRSSDISCSVEFQLVVKKGGKNPPFLLLSSMFNMCGFFMQ